MPSQASENKGRHNMELMNTELECDRENNLLCELYVFVVCC